MLETKDLLLTIGDVAREVGVCTKTLEWHERTGRLLPIARTVRGIRLYSRSDVDSFKAAHAKARERRDYPERFIA